MPHALQRHATPPGWPKVMTIGVAHNDNTLLEVAVWPTARWRVGRALCWECGGDGDWTKFYPEPEDLPGGKLACVDCKGTGWRYVAIA